MKEKEYARAIDAKKTFIKQLKKNETIDHQIRRAWLEIILIQIIAEDYYKIDESLQEFALDCPGGNPYTCDEYNVATSLKEAVQNKEFNVILTVMKKPIFSFLDNETVKQLKIIAMNPPQVITQPRAGATGNSQTSQKDKILNNIVL